MVKQCRYLISSPLVIKTTFVESGQRRVQPCPPPGVPIINWEKSPAGEANVPPDFAKYAEPPSPEVMSTELSACTYSRCTPAIVQPRAMGERVSLTITSFRF